MNKQVILSASKDKLAAALEILFASVDAYGPFDPARRYTPNWLRQIEMILRLLMRWGKFPSMVGVC